MSFSVRFFSGAVLATVTALAGCSAEPMREPQQSSQSKLLAPRALFKAKASSETTKAIGVVEWRVYRGRTDFVLTGYDKSGKAIQGASVSFVKQGKQNVMRARAFDGTFFAGRHVFGGKSASNRSASQKTQRLFHRAIADMMAVRASLARQGKISYVPPAQLPTGIDPNDPNAPLQDPFGTLGQSCGNDLMSMMMGALQCLAGTGGLGGASSAGMGQLLQCALAAQGAAASQGTCQDPGQLGTDPYDPYGMGQGQDPNDPYGMGQGQDPNDPYGMGQGQDPNDPYGMGQGQDPNDPYGMGQGQDPYGQDPYGQDPYGQDPYGQGDPFGQQDCQSCEGPYDDIEADPMNGGVSYDDMGGGMGGDYGGGDYGGGDMGGGDMGGFGEGY